MLELPAAKPPSSDLPPMDILSYLDIAWAHDASWGPAGLLLAS